MRPRSQVYSTSASSWQVSCDEKWTPQADTATPALGRSTPWQIPSESSREGKTLPVHTDIPPFPSKVLNIVGDTKAIYREENERSGWGGAGVGRHITMGVPTAWATLCRIKRRTWKFKDEQLLPSTTTTTTPKKFKAYRLFTDPRDAVVLSFKHI